MKEDIREEKQYCTSCGSINKKSAIFCTECEEKIVVRHRPFIDFLKKHLKDGVGGATTERAYTLIRKFILKHLYGAILMVSVVATATITVVTATPYIKKVSEPPKKSDVAVTAEKKPETKGVFELTEADYRRLDHVTTAYDAEIDNTLRNVETYWMDPEEYSSATELWAENNIEGYTYKGKHELYTNPFPMGFDDTDGAYAAVDYDWGEGLEPMHYRYPPHEGIRTGVNVRSELGHTLLADGYDVMEVDFYALTYYDKDIRGHSFDFNALPPADKTPYEKYVYTFLLTRKHGEGKWYIAEEVLTEKVGGPRIGG